MKGIWSAVLTPVDAAFVPHARTAVEYYRDLLERGCDGINLLGTTGEAMSFSVEQRMRFMSEIAASGLPMERVMVGTGSASLDDAARLTRHAFACGFTAALVMPPFFYRDAPDDGIVAFFDALIARADPPKNGILLYNFPRMSGIAFHPDLLARLLREFPGAIGGMKDSSNDAAFQTQILGRHPDFPVFPGSERDLLAARQRGVAGCISGSVALWPQLAQRVWTSDDAALAESLSEARSVLDGVSFVPAVRYLTAKARRDETWQRAMPPVVPLPEPQRDTLDRALKMSALERGRQGGRC